ncbi:hypothetical protein [Streptomyces venezuelae]|uniref:hypothetical protein n=1 Tax=Streptomyces venezuelae TaxID=54571 RepID=UPI0037CCCA67
MTAPHAPGAPWHVSDALARRYADGTAAETDAWSVEKHVEACGRCAARVSAAVRSGAAGPTLAAVRTDLLTTLGHHPEPATRTAAPSEAESPATAPVASPAGRPGTGSAGSPATAPVASPSGRPGTGPAGSPATAPVASPSGRPGTGPAGSPATAPVASPAGRPGTGLAGNHAATPAGSPATTPAGCPGTGPAGDHAAAPARRPGARPAGSHAATPVTSPARRPSTGPAGSPATTPVTSPSGRPRAPRFSPAPLSRWARLWWAVGPALRGAWVVAVVLVVGGAFGLAHGAGFQGARSLLLALSPVLPLAGVAVSYGRHADPLYEITAATPSGGLRLLLTRTAAVLAVCVPLLTAGGALLPPVAGFPGAAAWLLPGLALTLAALALGSFVGCRTAAVTLGGGWLLAVAGPLLGGPATSSTLVPYFSGPAAQGSWAAAALACGALLALRRRSFDHLEPR